MIADRQSVQAAYLVSETLLLLIVMCWSDNKELDYHTRLLYFAATQSYASSNESHLYETKRHLRSSGMDSQICKVRHGGSHVQWALFYGERQGNEHAVSSISWGLSMSRHGVDH